MKSIDASSFPIHVFSDAFPLGARFSDVVGFVSCFFGIHSPFWSPFWASKTSASSFSMTSSIKAKLSMKEFTATRSIRFVVALYCTRKTFWSCASLPSPATAVTVEKLLCTSGDSSLSTLSALTAIADNLAVGRGTSSCLERRGSNQKCSQSCGQISCRYVIAFEGQTGQGREDRDGGRHTMSREILHRRHWSLWEKDIVSGKDPWYGENHVSLNM